MNDGLHLEGADQLLELLDQIVDEQGGAKSINAVLRKATRRAAKTIILPAVKDAIPVDTGDLEDALQVRAIKGKRGRIGHTVGFPDPLFKGDTFYGGFLEFGYRRGKRPTNKRTRATDARPYVPADKFLRRSLYENETAVLASVKEELAAWIAERNREKPG
jgi:HK97 gp10 family phage protein